MTVHRLLPLALLLALGSACGVQPRTANTPWCDAFDTLTLAAQSVPSAELLPCIESLPLGWSAVGSEIRDGGTRFSLDSDIAGDNAVAVELSATCDVAGFDRVPTDEGGIQRYELVEEIGDVFRGRQFYLFKGGCVHIGTEFDVATSAALIDEVSLAIRFMPRSVIDDGIRQVTEGREQLDPPAND